MRKKYEKSKRFHDSILFIPHLFVSLYPVKPKRKGIWKLCSQARHCSTQWDKPTQAKGWPQSSWSRHYHIHSHRHQHSVGCLCQHACIQQKENLGAIGRKSLCSREKEPYFLTSAMRYPSGERQLTILEIRRCLSVKKSPILFLFHRIYIPLPQISHTTSKVYPRCTQGVVKV